MDLLFKGGTVVTAKSKFKADVAVKGGKIVAVGANLKPEKKTEVIDAKGKLILPGAIDGHTHLAMPFGGTIATDDYFTGTRAAACGEIVVCICQIFVLFCFNSLFNQLLNG